MGLGHGADQGNSSMPGSRWGGTQRGPTSKTQVTLCQIGNSEKDLQDGALVIKSERRRGQCQYSRRRRGTKITKRDISGTDEHPLQK